MVFKKYTRKDGKVYGPYLYENTRVGEKVVTKYVGAPKAQTKKVLTWLFLSLIALLSVVSIIHFLPHPEVSPTGNVVLDVNLVFEKGEPLRGDMKFNIKEGEFVPKDSTVFVELGNQTKEFVLSDLIIDNPTTGEFYAEDSDISGEGEGYGVEGEYTIYPTISFKLRVGSAEEIAEETPSSDAPSEDSNESESSDSESEVELETSDSEDSESSESETSDSSSDSETSSSDSESSDDESESSDEGDSGSSDSGDSGDSGGDSGGITGNVVGEGSYTIDAEVSKGHDFVYSLEEGQDAEIDSGSVMINGTDADSRVLKLTRDGNTIRVSTDYFINRRGYGEEFLGDYALSLNVPMDELDLTAEEGLLNITLFYENKHIASIETELSVSGEVNPNVLEENNSGIVLIDDIPNLRMLKNGESEIELDNYFSGAIDGYEFNVNNISADFNGDIAILQVDGDFSGSRKAKFVAYNENGSVSSNEFLILVSSGNLKVVTSREQIKVGEPVKWTKNISIGDVSSENISIEIPASAGNLTVTKVEDGGETTLTVEETGSGGFLTGEVSIELNLEKESGFTSWLKKIFRAFTGRVISDNGEEIFNTTELVLNNQDSDNLTSYIVEYYTDGPTLTETETSLGKEVSISAETELNYTDAIAFTNINSSFGIIDPSIIKIYWHNYDYIESNQSTELKTVDSVPEVQIVEVIDLNSSESDIVLSDISDSNSSDSGSNESVEVLINSSEESAEESNSSGISLTGNVIAEDTLNAIAVLENITSENGINVSDGNGTTVLVDSSVTQNDELFVLQEVPFDAYDLDEDGVIDYIEWVVPHFSTQTYNIIVTSSSTKISSNITYEGHISHLTVDSSTAPYNSLVAYYPFDISDSSGNNVSYDLSATNTDAILTDGASLTNSGLYGNATQLDGVNDFVNTSFVSPIGYNFTYSLWVKTASGASQLRGIITKRVGVGGSYQQLSLFMAGDALANTAGTKVGFNDNEAFPSISRIGISSVSINDGKWHHVAFSKGINDSLYIDGMLSASNSSGAIPNITRTDRLFIGATGEAQSPLADSYFNGSIDEVMLFNSSLTAQQVLDIYNNQSARFVLQGVQELPQVTLDNPSSQVNITFNEYQANQGSSIKSKIGHWNTSYGYNVNLYSGLVGYWTGDADASDLTGLNNGTLNGSASIGSGGVYGNSFVLDGVDDFIITPNVNQAITDKTLVAWVKLNNLYQGGGGLITFEKDTGLNFDSIVYNETSKGWGFGSDNWLRTAWSNTPETSTDWIQLVAVYSDNNYTLYRNGQSILTTTSFTAYQFPTSSRILIGKRHTGGSNSNLNASVDDAMLFSRALSAAEVKALYVKGLANWDYTSEANLDGSTLSLSVPQGTSNIYPVITHYPDNYRFYTPFLGSLTSGTNQTLVINTLGCTPPTAGIWNINCADYCSFSSTVDVPGDVNISGSGHVNVTSSGNWRFTSSNQKIYVYPGCKINVFPGGKIGV